MHVSWDYSTFSWLLFQITEVSLNFDQIFQRIITPPSRILCLKWINRIPVSLSKSWIKCVKASGFSTLWSGTHPTSPSYLVSQNTSIRNNISLMLDHSHHSLSNEHRISNTFVQLEHFTLLRWSLVSRAQMEALGNASMSHWEVFWVVKWQGHELGRV